MSGVGPQRVSRRIISLAAAVVLTLIAAPQLLRAEIAEEPLITNSSEQLSLDLYGDRLVWQDNRNGNWDIYLYDFATKQERRLTTDPSDQVSPAIWDNQVVWLDKRSGQWAIYLYDLATNTERFVVATPNVGGTPDISGNRVVWVTSAPSRDLYLYDLSTGVQQRLPVPSADDRRAPHIWGNRIIWNDFLNGPFTWYVFQYDVTTGVTQRVGSSAFKQEFPDIWQDRVVTYEYRGAKADIYLYDLTTGQDRQITRDPADQWFAAIQGDRVVWVDRRNESFSNGNYDIYGYDLIAGREFPLTKNAAQQNSPKIWGDRIVWIDQRNGNSDIYTMNLHPASFLPRHRLATGTEAYNFANFPWGRFQDPTTGQVTDTYGQDFGETPLGDRGVASNWKIQNDLETLHQAGVEGVRWFMLADGRNVTFDASGTSTGRTTGFRDDLWIALDLLDARQMSVVLTLIDGNTWFKTPTTWMGIRLGHADVIIDLTKRQALYQNVVIPILQEIAAWQSSHPDRPLPVAAIDLGNELFFGTNAYQGTGVSMAHLQAYVREATDVVHTNLPGVPVTVGAAHAQDLVSNWTDTALGVSAGQGLDFYSFHHHGTETLQGPGGLKEQYGLDRLGKRVYLQEFPGKNAALGGPEMYLAPIGGTRQGRSAEGWLSGSYLWSFTAVGDNATPDDPLALLQRINTWFTNAFDKPDLIISSVGYPQPIAPGSAVQFAITVANQGGVSAGSNQLELWLDGTQLGVATVPTLIDGDRAIITLPTTPWMATNGTHNLWTKADVLLQVAESDENNNEATPTITVNNSLPDLVVSNVSMPSPIYAGNPVQFAITVKNQGVASAGANHLELWLDGTQLAIVTVPALGVGQTTTFNVPQTPWTATDGTHNFWTKADVWLEVAELDENNNEATPPVVVQAAQPDLIVQNVSFPATITDGDSVQFTVTVKNQGTVSSTPNHLEFWLDGNKLATSDLPTLANGASATVTVPSPAWVAVVGTHSYWTKADVWLEVAESDENNNESTGTFTVQPKPVQPDIVMTALSGPATGATGTTIVLNSTVTNQGTASSGSFSIGFYLSIDATITTGDTRIGTRTVNGLAPGASSATQTSVLIPGSTAPQTYYLGAIADYANARVESDETNNAITGNQVALSPGTDLTITSVNGPASSARGSSITVANTARNQGVGESGSFSVGIYLSTDNVITTSDRLIGSRSISNLAASASNSANTTVTVPANLTPRTYYIGAIADYDSKRAETNETNNSRAGNRITVQ